jgi:hypothetical protein
LRAIFKGWAADPVNFVGKRTTKDRAVTGTSGGDPAA